MITWFWVQFGIIIMSEWLLIAQGESAPSAIMPFNCMRKHAIDCWLVIINLAKLTIHYNKYENVWDRQIYGIQVRSTLYSLQQIVATYKSLINQLGITLL